ncbi:cell division transport system ATP-binding protein [Thermonema lapsum]|jgi:cell division transport system ATP-binding protein|uniref:Cell division ATP-binding protein FtsE n=1 Tax=Thermonema lapsum TaxID=28195 RepID=A0A846MRG8_9BACT|nr:ATP-binding cassette domain-containing protein [Thermonema lapsum]NIK74153.1 cell division transport system ATP-binding protein [Thermonema lapsum]
MENQPDVVVSVKGATIYQNGMPVLSDVYFDVHKGEFVYIVGRTGSGKTSLLKTLYADLPLYKGDVEVAGIQLFNIKRRDIAKLRRRIGIVFQDFQLLMDRSVADNLFFVMRATGWRSTAKMKQRMNEVLLRVGLSGATSKMPHQLSGGEQQRVVIARALLNEPAILIADEPTGNLDPAVGEEIMDLFMKINRSGTAVLMATHNYQFIEQFPARVLKCEHGTLLDSTLHNFDLKTLF